jgi:hypothetical protein
MSNALVLAGRIAHPAAMLAGTYLRLGSAMVTGTGSVAVLLAGTALGASQLNQIVSQRRAVGTNGAVGAAVEPGVTDAVRSGGNIGEFPEAEIALQIELSGAAATSDLFTLALPEEDDESPLFIATMGGVRQCLIDFEVARVILDSAIVFLRPNKRSQLSREFTAWCVGACPWRSGAARRRR